MLIANTRRSRQPTSSGPPPYINWSSPFARGLRFAWVASHPQIELVTRVRQSAGVGTSAVYGTGGVARVAAANETVQFADRADWDILGDITCMAGVSWKASASTTDPSVITKASASSDLANCPFAFGFYNNADVDNVRVRLGRAHATGTRHWANGSDISVLDTYFSMAASAGSAMEVAPAFYINGRDVTGTPLNLFSGAGTGAPTANGNAPTIHGTHLLTRDNGQRIYWIYIWARQLSAREHYLLGRRGWNRGDVGLFKALSC